ncbi:MAG: transcriptional repressor LexA [bacterium]|jgi:repressor LexA|nr:transcriptional repressor LexA [bacterium]
MIKSVTETQEKVLNTIIDFIQERGFPPTIREIMNLMGYSSVHNVQRILDILEDKGCIRRNLRGGARCIEVIAGQNSSKENAKQLPIIGTVAAGTPLFAEQNIEGYFSFNTQLLGIDADFILRVKGESMKNARVSDNDLVLVKQTNFPENSDIVVALLDEEATVKRFFLEKDQIRLEPENPDFQPIIINKNDMYFKVLGKVAAVIHRL